MFHSLSIILLPFFSLSSAFCVRVMLWPFGCDLNLKEVCRNNKNYSLDIWFTLMYLALLTAPCFALNTADYILKGH